MKLTIIYHFLRCIWCKQLRHQITSNDCPKDPTKLRILSSPRRKWIQKQIGKIEGTHQFAQYNKHKAVSFKRQ